MSDEVKKVFLKNLKYAVIGVIVGALLSLATTTTYEKREFQVNLPSLLFSSATGFITGVLFSLLQAYEEVLSNHKKNLAACQIRYEDIAILYRMRHEANLRSLSEQEFQASTCTSWESEWL
jgi:hypothetical protein